MGSQTIGPSPLAISNQLTSTQITKAGTDLDLDTNCVNVWVKISYEGNKSLYLCTYYRPPSDKGESLEQLGISLNRVLCKKANSNIWVSGDFNHGHIDWNTPAVTPNKPEASLTPTTPRQQPNKSHKQEHPKRHNTRSAVCDKPIICQQS